MFKKINFIVVIFIVNFMFSNQISANDTTNNQNLIQNTNCEGVKLIPTSNAKYITNSGLIFPGSSAISLVMFKEAYPGFQDDLKKRSGSPCEIGKLKSKNVPENYSVFYRNEIGYSLEYGDDFSNSIAMIFSVGDIFTNEQNSEYFLIKLSGNSGTILAAYSNLPSTKQAFEDLNKAMDNKMKPLISASLNKKNNEFKINNLLLKR